VRAALLLACVGCGRIGFQPTTSTTGDGGASDAIGDALSAGLLLDFEFESDGLLHDRSGHHDAQCTNCPTLASDPMRGSVAMYAGTPCMSVPDAADLHPPQFTATAWFWMAANTYGDPLARPYKTATVGAVTLEINLTFNHISWGVNQMFINTPPPPIGEWHHIAGVFDGNVASVYLDATQVGPSITVGPVSYFDGDLYYIGCNANTGGVTDWWTGMLDSVRFYDHALSPSEIATIMAQ
jgi:hypothetical protein